MAQLSLKIKTTNGKTIETNADPDLTIFDLKAICCEELQTSPECQTFLFKGTVCDDDDTLEALKITNHSVLVVLLKKHQTKTQANEEKVDDYNRNQHTSNEMNNNINGIPQNPFGMMQNPNFLQQMMDSPMMKQMFGNPQMLQNIFSSSPHMKKLLEQHPELRHAMRDPAFLKQMMRSATDPKYRNEMMQNQDRALRNIESMPGGFNALSRMYNQVNDGMQSTLDDIHDQRFGKSQTKISEIDKTNGPTTEPIDNPWKPQSNNNNINGLNRMNMMRNNNNGNSNGMFDMMNMFNMMRGNDNQLNAGRAYVNKLRVLRNMGFNDEQKNIDALIATGGDIARAIQYLSGNTDADKNNHKK